MTGLVGLCGVVNVDVLGEEVQDDDEELDDEELDEEELEELHALEEELEELEEEELQGLEEEAPGSSLSRSPACSTNVSILFKLLSCGSFAFIILCKAPIILNVYLHPGRRRLPAVSSCV